MSTGKRQLQIHCATHEELLAKGYVLSLNELNLPPSSELDEIIHQCPTNQAQFCGNSFVVSSGQWLARWFQAYGSGACNPQ